MKRAGLFAIPGGIVGDGGWLSIVRWVPYLVGTMSEPTVRLASKATPCGAGSAEPFSLARSAVDWRLRRPFGRLVPAIGRNPAAMVSNPGMPADRGPFCLLERPFPPAYPEVDHPACAIKREFPTTYGTRPKKERPGRALGGSMLGSVYDG